MKSVFKKTAPFSQIMNDVSNFPHSISITSHLLICESLIVIFFIKVVIFYELICF